LFLMIGVMQDAMTLLVDTTDVYGPVKTQSNCALRELYVIM